MLKKEIYPKTIRLKVVYSNQVPADAYQNGSFNYIPKYNKQITIKCQ